jgi:plastocyanin
VARGLLAQLRALRAIQLVNKFTIPVKTSRRLFGDVNFLALLRRLQAMRFKGLALAAAAIAMGACGGGDNAADTSAAAPAATGGAPAGAVTAAPVTGAWHEVQMLGDEKGYVYKPTDLTIKAGDGVRWIMVSGPPHNVVFQNVAADAKAQLGANMPNQLTELGGPMMLNPNEKYEVSFANVKPGKYDYICQPHLANNMRGSITVQ